MRGAHNLVAVVVLTLAACGGNEGGLPSVSTTVGSSTTFDEGAVAVATLVERWDDRLAFFAVAAAWDNGYSTVQIVEGAATLSAEGTIAGEAPDAPDLGLLTPLGSGDAASLPLLATAPRILLAAGGEPRPQDQFISGLGRTLDEGFEAMKAHLDRMKVREALAEELADLDRQGFGQYVVGVTLMLGVAGYSPEQIIEGIFTDSLDAVRTTVGFSCVVLAGPFGPVVPLGLPFEEASFQCPGVFSATTTTTTTTTTTSTDDTDLGDDEGFGTYAGTVTASGEAAPFITILDSAVTVTITPDRTDLRIELEMDLILVAADDNNPACVTRERWILVGSAPPGSAIDASLTLEGYELLAISGCEASDDDDDDDDDGVFLFTGSAAGGRVTGSFIDGAFLITAERP